MKKIKLSFKNMKEVLSRNELKSIVGGFASGGSGGNLKLCHCGPKADCDVWGLPHRNCTQICEPFSNGC